MRTSSHRKPQQIAFNNSSDNAFDGFKKIYKKCFTNPCFFLVYDTALPAENSYCFRQNLTKSYTIIWRNRLILDW